MIKAYENCENFNKKKTFRVILKQINVAYGETEEDAPADE